MEELSFKIFDESLEDTSVDCCDDVWTELAIDMAIEDRVFSEKGGF